MTYGTLKVDHLQSSDGTVFAINEIGGPKADLVNGKIPAGQLPSIAISDFLGEAADGTELVALAGEKGDWAIRTDTGSTWVIVDNDGSSLADWVEIASPASPVTSVNGQVGAVVLAASDVNAATAAQGALADSAIQPGDNISALTNDAAFITSAQAPVQSVAGKSGAVTLVKADITDFADGDYATAAQGALADSALQAGDIGSSVQGYDANTVVDGTYVHTDNNYTSAEKAKLAAIEEGAEVNVSADWNATSGDAAILNKPTLGTASAQDVAYFATAAQGALADTALQPAAIGVSLQAFDASLVSDGAYVHTDNNYTTAEKDKLAGIEAGAEVNVNADWSAASGDAAILNKPALGTAAAEDIEAFATAAQGGLADSALQPGDAVSDLTNDAAYITSAEAPVQSVAGKTGAVTLVKADVGLNNVNNTADANKPISNATQAALDGKADLENGKLKADQIPDLAISSFLGEAASEAAMLALSGQRGDWAVRTDTSESYILVADDASQLASWRKLLTPVDAVLSVNGETGAVSLDAADVGAATSAQGALADTAVQPGDDISDLVNDAGYITSVEAPVQSVAGKTGAVSLVKADISDLVEGDYATAGQGSLADSALQPGDIGVSVQAFSADTVVDASYVHTDNNYTSAEKSKLAGIADGAEVNVNADWSASSGDAQILNKPTLGTAAAQDSTAFATAAQGGLADSAIQPGDNISELTNNANFITAAGAPVQSVAGKTGTVTLAKGDVGLGNVDNTSDANKPVSTAAQAALDLKAPLASPALTGTPTAPTAAADTNSTQVATTAYVVGQGYLKSAAAASTYAPIASPTLTGTPAAPTAAADTNSTQIATTAYVVGQGYLKSATASSTYAPLASPALTGAPTAPTAAAGTNTTQIATTAFVQAATDAAKQGLTVKQSCRVATTANITLSGTQTIDGISVAAGERVLVKNQTTGSENGIYVVASGSWARATDFDASADVADGAFTFVEEGSSNADSGWVLTTDGAITVGTTALSFTQFSGAGQITAGNGLTKTGNQIDVVGTSGRIVANADSIDLASGVATAGTYKSVTVDTYGRVTAGTNPTSLSGYGITDAQPLDADLTAIAALAGTSGLLKKTAADTWSLDTSTYLTGNQSISVTGDATGSGTTSISLTLANSGATAGTYRSVTVDAKGRVTAGTNPTTLSGYGITDAASSTHAHGNITNAGAIGSTANLPIITTTSGVLTTGSFGTAANTFCQGNDSRLSDTRNTSNSVTFNNGGTGAASGGTFNGSSAVTVSYNTVGAPSTTGTNASGTWGISVTGSAASATSATTASTANALNTANNYQVNSLGVGTAASGTAGEIRATNNVTAYYSDERLKTRLGEFEDPLGMVEKLSGFYYEANETAQALGYTPVREVGVSAQEVEAVLPEAVAPAPIDEQYLTVRYERIVPLLIEAVKELSKRVQQLEGGN
jgi:hypothetical protein